VRCTQVACKQEQVDCLKAALTECPDAAPKQAAAALEEAACLRAQLSKQQLAQRQQDRKAAQQLAALQAALAQANAHLKAVGVAPVAAEGADCRDATTAVDQHMPFGSDALEEGPPTPLSPGEQAPPPPPKGSASSWDGSEEPLQPLACCSPEKIGRGGAGVCDAPYSPGSDLSGPNEDHDAGEGEGAQRGSRSAGFGSLESDVRASAMFGSRFARNNPLFCSNSAESRRTACGLASGEGLLQTSLSEGLAMSGPAISSRGVATLGLVQTQLEIQVGFLGGLHMPDGLCRLDWNPLVSRHSMPTPTPSPPPVLPLHAYLQLHRTQQRLGAMQSSAAVASNQAAAAQARLRASVRCLENLHFILKSALEQFTRSAPIDLQVSWSANSHDDSSCQRGSDRALAVASCADGVGLCVCSDPLAAAFLPFAGGAYAAGRCGARPGAYGEVPARDGRLPRHATPAAAAAGNNL
jgi:hypothetical protein